MAPIVRGRDAEAESFSMTAPTAAPPEAPVRLPQPVELWLDQPRVDALDKVTGAARYVDDLPDPPGTVYVAPLRSPYAHARVVSIDSSPARALPGVLAVLDRESLPEYGVHVEEHTKNPELITIDTARYQGDLLAMVAATDVRTARRAVEMIHVTYQTLPSVFDAAHAFAPGAPSVHEDVPGNLALEAELAWGDVEQGLAEADQVIEATFRCGQITHHPMEPAMSFLVDASSAFIEYWIPTNNPFDPVRETAALFGVPAEQVRAHVPYLGGAFGAKHMSPVILVAAAISRKIARPVRFLASEDECYQLVSSQAVAYHGRVGLRADGTLLALDVELENATGAYLTGGGRVATQNALSSTLGGYRLPHFRARARTAYTNTTPATYFRNTGKNPTAYGVEALMDMVACQRGDTPLDFRLRNLLERGEPAATHVLRGGKQVPISTLPLDTDFSELMQRAVDAIGWDGRSRQERPAPPRGRVRGRGLVAVLRPGASPNGRVYAMATLQRDGTVKISQNAPELGMGAYTMVSVVAARTLGISQSQVQVGEPDTSNELPFPGASSQRTTVQMGAAVQNACENLQREILQAASLARGGAPADWRMEKGCVLRGAESLTLADLARLYRGDLVLKGIGAYAYAPPSESAFGRFDHWAPSAAAAEVEVDTETGEVTVLQFAAVADAGKVIHYNAARGQVQGGVVMGLGIALFEELRYEEGQLLNGDPFQYRLPLLGDVPRELATSIVENGDGPGPFGSKGLAQTSIGCVTPALCNAIYDALGVRVFDAPFTPEKILRALGTLSEGN